MAREVSHDDRRGRGVRGRCAQAERPLALKEKAKVHVTIEAKAEEAPAAADDDDPRGWKAAREFIGMCKDAPARSSTSLSEDHDQALYKRK